VKTDSLFYDFFQEFPQIFFELIGSKEINHQAYQFTSPELKQRAFRLDGVLAPKEEFANEPIYFVEIQFYKDEEFYNRLFSEIFLYFSQYQPSNGDWYAIVIYASRSNESSIPQRYNSLIEPHLRRFYLNELTEVEDESIERGIVRLVVESEKNTCSLAKKLIERTREELSNKNIQKKILDFIETIVVYKFPSLSREEIETMLNLSLLKETRVYQEAFEEGELQAKLKLIQKLLQKGLSIQEVSNLLELDLETVRQAARQ
jgi:predicted transposase/invertase (TIGR01784 family)